MKALIIQPDGREETFELMRRMTLEELQAAVGGGYIENVIMAPQSAEQPWSTCYANEDGIGKEMPFNPKATTMTLHRQPLVGPVIFLDYWD